jgi:hypothetical protein
MNILDSQFNAENCIIHFVLNYFILPVPVAARSEARTVLNRSNTGIVVSNPDRGMVVCPRFSILCSPV